MTETKLRDVILGVLQDELDTELRGSEYAQVADAVIHRLAHAQSIELDDGTLFVRRAPLPQITISTATSY